MLQFKFSGTPNFSHLLLILRSTIFQKKDLSHVRTIEGLIEIGRIVSVEFLRFLRFLFAVYLWILCSFDMNFDGATGDVDK